MIETQIEIALDDDHRWFVQWKAASGATLRRTFGNRLSLLETMPHILAEVRGIAYPSIDLTPDETITIGSPARRRTD